VIAEAIVISVKVVLISSHSGSRREEGSKRIGEMRLKEKERTG